ncbi:MAG: TIGR04283 family arsenosugar biosynthesis glycosyltransferase [Planctomycetota bacterium]
MKISVIVPVLNEAERIGAHLTQLRSAEPHQLIVVDGGSDDGSVASASDVADRVVSAPRGLAQQLNAGAEAADGEALVFVYADTQLPSTWPATIVQTLAQTNCVGGAFRLALDDRRWRYRFTAFAANLRGAIGCGPFGDQALFVRRDIFADVGGYDATALLEDLDLVRRLRRRGRVQIASAAAVTSVRRWEAGGFLATMLRNWKYLACHTLGLRGKALRRHYQAYRSGDSVSS